ncbi:G-patch domain protein (Spp2), putative [Cordyceps militaris CM01]|uniref:Pre-mRNA-splicing factor n=1 Tax=Cordyceps militaris (strain CM01) TaxID=983644 RepID=G3JQ47_CORMM|nr:G-patch domain protein (Spp2), putative [Cordyceps militaris CM01]EGX89298.1 G-patch domain protein (Spp2), putative [Cordyceps militaris CM01]
MTDDSKGGRIAIKFSAPSSSASKAKTPASSLGKRPRSTTSTRAFGGGGGDDSDSDSARGQHEVITGFGANGAETKREEQAAAPKREYVIARQPNRDWRDEIKEQRDARRGKNLLPAEARAAQNRESGGSITTVDTAPADQDSGIQWGLTVKEKQPPLAAVDTAAAPTTAADTDDDKANAQQPAEPVPAPRSADDEAMDALLGKRPAQEDKVIATEDDAYARDVSRAGATSTLADYEAMPVEEFGAALLRGMGWDGKPRTAAAPGVKKPQEAPRRRQNRLGLGAKALNEAEDLGGWNQKSGAGPPGGKKRPPKLADYRREEERKKEERRGGAAGAREDSYKREREREREDRHRDRERDNGHRHGHRDRDNERDRDRRRGDDRDRRR